MSNFQRKSVTAEWPLFFADVLETNTSTFDLNVVISKIKSHITLTVGHLTFLWQRSDI